MLECLLTTAGVRGDVPALVDKLFDGFGGLKGILEARPDQLMMIPGMREKPAALISMVTPLALSGRSVTCGSLTESPTGMKLKPSARHS